MQPLFNIIGFTFCIMLLFTGCSKAKKTSHYKVNVAIHPEKQSLSTLANITYIPKANEKTDSITFIGHENIMIKKCIANGLIRYHEEQSGNKAKTIVLYFENEIEKNVNITFEYDFTLTPDDAPWGIDKISNDWIELSLNSGWLPILSTYDNQFSADASISVVSKNKFEILFSGTSKKLGKNTFQITNVVPQIDLVLLGSSNFEESIDRNIAIYERKINTKRNNFIHQLGNNSHQWLNNKFGKVKKLPSSKLVITPRTESGYARKNLIVLSNDISVKDTIHFVNYITHEFAHFWSTGANPLSPHRWLDESIAEYIAWKYIEEKFNTKYLRKFLDTTEKEAVTIPPVYIKGNNEIPKHAVMYRKGVYKLFKLEQMIGQQTMFLLLEKWFNVKEKNSENFLKQLEAISGTQISENFRHELSL